MSSAETLRNTDRKSETIKTWTSIIFCGLLTGFDLTEKKYHLYLETRQTWQITALLPKSYSRFLKIQQKSRLF